MKQFKKIPSKKGMRGGFHGNAEENQSGLEATETDFEAFSDTFRCEIGLHAHPLTTAS